MTLEAVEQIRVRLGGQSHELQPGQRIDLPEDKGRLLLERAPGKLRIIETGVDRVTIEPTGTNARPVYWESADGIILGPAVPEFLSQVGRRHWIIVQFDGGIRWIRSDRLRSKKAFDRQVKPIPFERIKEPK